MQTKHKASSDAIKAAHQLRDEHCQIIKSRDGGAWANPDGSPKPICYFVESGSSMGMIRHWERLVYSGPGKNATDDN